jgi:cysteine-rich repeat protein
MARRATALVALIGAVSGWVACATSASDSGHDPTSSTTSSTAGPGGGGLGGDGGTGGDGGALGGAAGDGGDAGEGGSTPMCGDGAIEGDEECDGASSATCGDLGWMGPSIPCTVGCTHDLSVCDGCGNGVIEPVLEEDCDFDSQGDPLVLASCASLGFTSSGANPDCNPVNCQFDTKICLCGDGIADTGEACDGGDLDGHTCVTEGYTAGMLLCTPDCDLDASLCTLCGNGGVEGTEVCDGGNLDGHTCVTEGFTAGMISCTSSCTLDTSLCTTCGNGVTETGEQCDDHNTMSGDGCSSTCMNEVVACDPDGVYMVLGGPLNYSCCSGLVSVSVSSFLLNADGAAIATSPSNPVTMGGSPTTCPSGSFANSGSIAGGCTETYSVSGTFSSTNQWSGLYSVTFTGSDCDCFGGLFGTPCVNQVFPVTAQK